jgi:hypothetical protein
MRPDKQASEELRGMCKIWNPPPGSPAAAARTPGSDDRSDARLRAHFVS